MKLVPLKDKNIKKSFNEPDVEITFEPIAHTYFHNGIQLESATGYIKRFLKPFDNDMVSFMFGKKHGINKTEVQKIWKDGGEAASDFGTCVHKMIENLLNNYKNGAVIQFNRGDEENYALPKHPILLKIMRDFLQIFPFKDDLISEALISDVKKNVCGHADLINVLSWEEKRCRIGDFKINVDSELEDPKNKVLSPFDNLPATKLSKYQLQMSVYANMLQESGWTVEGLDVYVLEDEWKHYKLDVLKVIS